MEKFISCDWGTSALRLRLVDAATATVLAETDSPYGISTTFELWKNNREKERLAFYQSVLVEQVKRLEEKTNLLEGLPFIISGMASSNIGMIELPYKEIPFKADAHSLYSKTIDPSNDFDHKIILISGIKTIDDVMRGEETQLIGCIDEMDKDEHFFIFPGTHSKHVIVKKGNVVDLKTYMTGEFFELLSAKSILANAVKATGSLDIDNLKSFGKGVVDSLHSNLLHSSFLVRTNDLFATMSKEENYYYLSGLLIGIELKEVTNNKKPITVVGNETMIAYYAAALEKLGLNGIKSCNAGDSIVKGHCKILKLYNNS